mgnify:FL=1
MSPSEARVLMFLASGLGVVVSTWGLWGWRGALLAASLFTFASLLRR